jgi:hypothetical protein
LVYVAILTLFDATSVLSSYVDLALLLTLLLTLALAVALSVIATVGVFGHVPPSARATTLFKLWIIPFLGAVWYLARQPHGHIPTQP